MNLFASFAANNFLWLIWYHVILDTNILEGKDQVRGLYENHFIMKVCITTSTQLNLRKVYEVLSFYKTLVKI